jgi:hypothetical protein
MRALLGLEDFKHWTEEDVRVVVRESFSKNQPRFALVDDNGLQ